MKLKIKTDPRYKKPIISKNSDSKKIEYEIINNKTFKIGKTKYIIIPKSEIDTNGFQFDVEETDIKE